MNQALAGVQLLMAGRIDDGIARIRLTLQKAPGFGFGHMPLWSALHSRGSGTRPCRRSRITTRGAQGEAAVVDALKSGRATGGYEERCARAAAVLAERSRSRHVPPVNLAQLYDKARATDLALSWLERGYAERDPNMAYVGVMPFSDELRTDPRFRDLLRRMKLSDRRARPDEAS